MSKKRVEEEQEYNSGSNQYEEERDVEDEDEGSECNITNDDLDKIAVLSHKL
jgi:hypothetical protein